MNKNELLLKDICARMPYGVKLWHESFEDVIILHTIDATQFAVEISIDKPNSNTSFWNSIEQVKPYLFPLSSMTDEHREELYKIGWYLDEDKIYSCFRNYDDENYKTHIDCFELINWCYKNNFDINGLIPMGLAIDATDKNIY